MFKPELTIISGGKDTPLDRGESFKSKVYEGAIIEEEKIFSDGEVFGIVEQAAQQEGIRRDELQILHEVRDGEGHLVELLVGVKLSRARGQGWKDITFEYIIKGNHGPGLFSDETSVSRMYDTEDPALAQGGIVARYSRGTGWQFSPDEISPKGTDIDLGEDE